MILLDPCLPSNKMRVGFTGSRNGLTADQRRRLFDTLSQLVPIIEAHHGDCVGADAEFHDWCVLHKVPVIIHPPEIETMRAFKTEGIILAPQPYLARNKAIVRACDMIVACPESVQETQRSELG